MGCPHAGTSKRVYDLQSVHSCRMIGRKIREKGEGRTVKEESEGRKVRREKGRKEGKTEVREVKKKGR